MAATGTPTPNIGLRRPQGTDPASVDDINYNSNLIDTKLGAVGNTSVQAQINSLNSKINIIGTISTKSDNAIIIPHNTLTEVVSLTLEAGTYIVIATGAWVGNATGYRGITTTNSLTATTNRANIVNAVNGSETRNQFVYTVTSSTQFTITLKAQQNSGGDLQCYPYIDAIKIA